MQFSALFSLSALAATLVSSQQFQVPTPWYITNIVIGNIRHGTGGYWQFNIQDTPTAMPQGFNTTCYYYGQTTYIFALDDVPYNAPCNDPSVTFGFFPNGHEFTFNVTHLWNSGTTVNNDNGTFTFSYDSVRGQEMDVQNNFGQAGGFTQPFIAMYPNRAVPSTKCEFC